MRLVIALSVSAATGILLAGCGKGSGSAPEGTKAVTATDTNSPADYLGGLVRAKKTADKTIDVAYLNQALQLFNTQEGRYPKSLQELTPNYVGKIPEPPIGYKLDYDAAKGEVKIVAQ